MILSDKTLFCVLGNPFINAGVLKSLNKNTAHTVKPEQGILWESPA